MRVNGDRSHQPEGIVHAVHATLSRAEQLTWNWSELVGHRPTPPSAADLGLHLAHDLDDLPGSLRAATPIAS